LIIKRIPRTYTTTRIVIYTVRKFEVIKGQVAITYVNLATILLVVTMGTATRNSPIWE